MPHPVNEMHLVAENRLRWQCRRGMLELDACLSHFNDAVYASLTVHEQADFVRLLMQDDFQIFDWLTGQSDVPADLRAIVERLREAAPEFKQELKVNGNE